MSRRQVRPADVESADHVRRKPRQPELRRRQDRQAGEGQGVRRRGPAGGQSDRADRRRGATGADRRHGRQTAGRDDPLRLPRHVAGRPQRQGLRRMDGPDGRPTPRSRFRASAPCSCRGPRATSIPAWSADSTATRTISAPPGRSATRSAPRWFASTGSWIRSRIEARIELVTKEIELPRTYREIVPGFPQHGGAGADDGGPHRAADVGHVPGRDVQRDRQAGEGGLPRAVRPPDGLHQRQHRLFPHATGFSQGGYEPGTSHLDPTAELVYMREIAALMRSFP